MSNEEKKQSDVDVQPERKLSEKIPEYIDTEEVLTHIENDSMKYQKCVLITLFLCGLSIASFGSLLSYQTIMPEMLCAPLNDPKNFSSCSMEMACSANTIAKVDTKKSIINWMVDYNLICSRSYISEVMIYIFYGGCILSALMVSPLADKYGRKNMLAVIMLAYFIITLKAISSDGFVSLIFVLVASGLFCGSYYNIAIMQMIECTSLNNRAWYASLLFSSAPIGGFIVAPLIDIFRDWKIVSAIISVSAFILTITIAFMKDSPRYHVGKFDYKNASLSAADLIYWNNNKNEMVIYKERTAGLSNEMKLLFQKRSSEPFNYWELFAYQSIAPVTYVMIICSFLFNNMYLGMVLNSETSILSSTYSAMISAASDFVSCVLAGYMLTSLKRRGSIVTLFHYLTCLLALLIPFVDVIAPYFGIVLPIKYHAIAFVFNRFLSLVALDAAYLYAIESFPTRIRGKGIGLCSVFANIGKLLAYLITNMGHKFTYIFAIISIVGFHVLRFIPTIPDMGEHPLSDDIEEIEEAIYSKKKY